VKTIISLVNVPKTIPKLKEISHGICPISDSNIVNISDESLSSFTASNIKVTRLMKKLISFK
jgi:hypothetical protein